MKHSNKIVLAAAAWAVAVGIGCADAQQAVRLQEQGQHEPIAKLAQAGAL